MAQSRLLQRGFGLAEIMVGLAIGMLTVLVIMQVFSNFEGDKRATTGTSEAQINGSIALDAIFRDAQLAGYGSIPAAAESGKGGATPLKCDPMPTIDAGYKDDPIATTGNRLGYGDGFALAPVVILDGGNAAGANDTLTIRYGSSSVGGASVEIKTHTTLPDGTVELTVESNVGCRVCEIATIYSSTTGNNSDPGLSCTASTIIGPHAAGGTCPKNKTNPPPFSAGVFDKVIVQDLEAAKLTTGSRLACLGRQEAHIYAISGNDLTRDGVPLISNVVSLQVQYGVSDAPDKNQITQWVSATNAYADDWSIPTIDMRSRIKAIRVAIITRNTTMEKSPVSTACSSTTDPNATGICAWRGSAASPAPAVDLSNNADWANYRYRVFETIIPLRNVIWSYEALAK